MKCVNCGKELPFRSRSDRKTCGPNCRKAWSRRGEKIDLLAGEARYAISQLRLMMKEYPDLKSDVQTQLRRLETDIRDVFIAYPDTDQLNRAGMLYEYHRKRQP